MSVEAVVIVPGIMGSELLDGDKLIWPGDAVELLLPYKHMAQLLKPQLIVGDLIRSFSISTQYAALISALERCGFHEHDKPQSLYVCPYDWRRDNREAANRLGELIDRIFHEHPNGVQINLIAHSMGGLVSRYYLESGLYAKNRGYGSICRLITLGTPHQGAPLALSAALGRERRLFLNETQVQELANDPNFPALYQLLPPPYEPFAWNQDRKARFAPLDIYSSEVSGQIGLSSPNLKATVNFRKMLDVTCRPLNVGYFFFVGTQQTTMTEARVTLKGGTDRARVEFIARDDGGDGTVPVWSGTHTGFQSAAVGGEHGTIYKNAGLQQVLAALLGKEGVLAGVQPIVELVLRDQVVEPGDETRAGLSFDRSAALIDGEI